ncbi:MAG: ATPase [Alphaproteobacteria bacterium]|nr:ATPase [Alphaproteobacteria bacterium]
MKRFYKEVTVSEAAPFAILLDGRTIKTPGGRQLTAPTKPLAEALAAEWREQGEIIVPDTMPLTKLMNTALDRVPSNRHAIVDDLASYAGSDLLCYRADTPAELVRRQTAAWDPWLAWAAERHSARLTVVTGVSHTAQPTEALARLRAAIAAHDDLTLTALHVGITLTGSAILGLAFAARVLTADDAFALSQIDEIFQAERWGSDAEAERMRAARLNELRAAGRLLTLIA